jgi:anaerobic selenocysteine-containing dehydrogenase
MSDNQNKGAENPEQFTGLHLGPIKKAAAGIPAIVESIKQVVGEAGAARGLKALNHMNQKGGFDCPSCAWPDPDDDRSTLGEYCENGAKAVAEEATLKKLTPEFFAENSVQELAALTDYEIGRKGRIAQPMYLPHGATHYQPITWDDAFHKIGVTLNKLSSPDEAIFYTSGRTSNEAAFLYQLFVRAYGTNNLPDCSNMCHESSGVALGESLGIGKGSVKLEDFYEAEVIIILGQNPGTNHPRMLTALQKAKANGARIIAVNPLPETGLMGFNNPQSVKGLLGMDTHLTDIFLPVIINGDMALLKAVEYYLWQHEQREPGKVFDRAFIENNTAGYDDFINHLQQQNPEQLAQACGISLPQIQEVAGLLKDKTKIIACWAMGLTQHVNAVDTIKEIVNLLLLKGSIGKPGYDVVEAIKAMHGGKASVFIAMGGNFLSATPDTLYTAAALRKCMLTVHVSTKLNRSHLVHGHEALILPCLGRSDKDVMNGEEQIVSCENSMGVIQLSRGVLTPVSDQLLSEPVIVCRLAKATLGNRSPVDWDRYLQHYDHIRSAIEQTIPGFGDYNKRLRDPGGFYLPNCNRDGAFNTLTKKAHFNIAPLHTIHLHEGELLMMTIRSHDQFNTTIYGLNDRYRGIYQERRVILMNQGDMNQRNLKQGDVVDLYNHHGGVERVAHKFIVVPYPIPPTCAATYFPETNVLVPVNSVAKKSNTPTSKAVVIKVVKRES